MIILKGIGVKKMKIAIDLMGGDLGLESNLKGCVDAINEYQVEMIFVGKEDEIKKALEAYSLDKKYYSIVDAQEVISNEEKAGMAILRKKESSMVKALNLVKEGEAQAVISAGSTGALLSGATLLVGRINGIKRPALAPVMPTIDGVAVLIDAGANVDSKPEYLKQFGVMGSIYAEKVIGIQQPKVGLANIGEEAEKGNELVKQAYELLTETDINFIGNLEVRDVFTGKADVIVCDGFVGNTILKTAEGTAKMIMKLLKRSLMSSLKSKIGALLLKSSLTNLKKEIDYSEYGGAPLLGVNGGVIKAHGSSDANAIKNAIRQAKVYCENDVTGLIAHAIEKTL